MAYEFEIGAIRSRASGFVVPVCSAGAPFERNSRRRSSDVVLRGMPPRNGDAASDHRLLCLLANGSAAAIHIAVGAPWAANRRGDGRGAALTTVTTSA